MVGISDHIKTTPERTKMTDTPMTKDEHDTLIERLEKEASRAENGRFSSRELYAPVMREAISRLKQSQWTPIEDIPEDWKDRRRLLTYVDDEDGFDGPIINRYHPNYGWEYDYGKITHAMLPPQAPKG